VYGVSKISVIVPVYKVREYLRRCVDSILAQSFQTFDLILVDDGSPDECGAICDEYAKQDTRVHVIHQENQGLSEARNVGIEWALKNSSSEWITFIDSDDWIHRDYLKILYEIAIDNHVELSICNCIKTPEKSVEFKEAMTESKIFTPEDFWCFRQYGGAWAKLYKKDHFKEIRYPKGLLYEDIFVTYRLLFMQDKVVYIESPLYYYFLRDDSITKSQWDPRVLSQLQGMKEQLRFYKKYGYIDAYKVTVRNYLIAIQNQMNAAKQLDNKYSKEYNKLKKMYRFNILKFCRYFPIRKYTNMYRQAFPRFTKFYKKLTYLKGEKRNGK
jgi:glycosyltransferase involved in cell wall biosynthesis